MEITLKEYLIRFFDVGESFFDDGVGCHVDFKGSTLGFVTKNILKKISFGKSFVSLEEAFPTKKKIKLSFAVHPWECRTIGFSSPSGTFKEAILKYDKYKLDLKHDETSDDDSEKVKLKLLKKNKLTMCGQYFHFNEVFDGWHEVYFHHDYEAAPFKFNNTYNLCDKNHFLLKKGKRIFYIDTQALEQADWVRVAI